MGPSQLNNHISGHAQLSSKTVYLQIYVDNTYNAYCHYLRAQSLVARLVAVAGAGSALPATALSERAPPGNCAGCLSSARVLLLPLSSARILLLLLHPPCFLGLLGPLFGAEATSANSFGSSWALVRPLQPWVAAAFMLASICTTPALHTLA